MSSNDHPPSHRTPPRRALSAEEANERLMRCYDLLLEAAAEAEARAAQQPSEPTDQEPAP